MTAPSRGYRRLQTEGCCFSLPIRFAAEEECIDWIKSHVIGVGFLEPLGG
jgi:hypothetical protein